MICLVEALAEAPIIAKLDLSENKLTDSGVIVLLRLLRGQVKLAQTVKVEDRLSANFLGQVEVSSTIATIDSKLIDEIQSVITH